jgi:hypothetical protein
MAIYRYLAVGLRCASPNLLFYGVKLHPRLLLWRFSCWVALRFTQPTFFALAHPTRDRKIERFQQKAVKVKES